MHFLAPCLLHVLHISFSVDVVLPIVRSNFLVNFKFGSCAVIVSHLNCKELQSTTTKCFSYIKADRKLYCPVVSSNSSYLRHIRF
ncbi:hypothetical protein BRADI_5g08269v3 [Brachypodium distachyon]|uniref:Secreted protein n=1 Tax=Brachypodium distachyon TaxID=15368 RepID=A0A0Q3E3R9_BRADI|nr:hypothetical protein BRADI_5g08269v3 [Brachypodium distachyon]